MAGKSQSEPRWTGEFSVSGRPLYDAGNGDVYSEKSVTFPIGKAWYTFPSVDANGYIMPEDEVWQYVAKYGPIDPLTGERLPQFSSEEEAVDYAKKRSASRVHPSLDPDLKKPNPSPYGTAIGGLLGDY